MSVAQLRSTPFTRPSVFASAFRSSPVTPLLRSNWGPGDEASTTPMCMHGRLVGVATVCMHSSCVIWQIAWSKEPEDRCMQKPEYRARDVATLEDFLQILYNCMMHVWLFDGIILHWYMIVIWVSAISFCYCFWSRFCACLLQLHILSKTPLGKYYQSCHWQPTARIPIYYWASHHAALTFSSILP